MGDKTDTLYQQVTGTMRLDAAEAHTAIVHIIMGIKQYEPVTQARLLTCAITTLIQLHPESLTEVVAEVGTLHDQLKRSEAKQKGG